MQWPQWIRNKTTQWIIVGVALPVFFFIFPYLFSDPPSKTDDHSVNIHGSGNTVNYKHNTTDTDALAEKLAAKMKVGKDELAVRDEEIKNLKTTIDNLKKDSSNTLKQQALQALEDGDIQKATSLMEEAAEKHTAQASQDWVDIGNIAYLHDSQKALDAYQRALEIDPSNLRAWNRSGLVLMRLGRLGEAIEAFQQVSKLAADDQSIQAIAYTNLGNIYQTRGDLDKACKAWQKSLALFTKIGAKSQMELVRGWIHKYCSTSPE